jgi:hypothetical protein
MNYLNPFITKKTTVLAVFALIVSGLTLLPSLRAQTIRSSSVWPN